MTYLGSSGEHDALLSCTCVPLAKLHTYCMNSLSCCYVHMRVIRAGLGIMTCSRHFMNLLHLTELFAILCRCPAARGFRQFMPEKACKHSQEVEAAPTGAGTVKAPIPIHMLECAGDRAFARTQGRIGPN